MILHLRFAVLSFLAISLLGVSITEAGLIVSIGNTEIEPGGTGSVDITIQSDSSSGDLLAQFGFEFRISTLGATQLDFANPQGDSQLSDPTYVFAGDSLADAFPTVGSVGSVVVPNDTFIGGDATFGGGNVLVSTTLQLLARLDFTAAPTLPPGPGDTFLIALIAGPNTFFQNSDFNDIAYITTPGSVTVVVPEPAAGVLSGCALLGMLFTASLCRKAHRQFPTNRA